MAKILFTSHTSKKTGAPLVLLNVVKHLKERGFESATLFPSHGECIDLWKKNNLETILVRNPELAFSQIPFYKIPILFFQRIKSFLQIMRKISILKPDLIYINSIVNLLPAFAAFLLGKKIIWHSHETVPNTLKNIIKGFFISLLSDKIILVSPTCGHILTKGGMKKSTVIFNGIDVDKFKNAKADKDTFDEFSIPHESKVVLFIGSIIERKGLDILIKAAAQIIQHRRDVIFLIVGSVPETSKEFFERIKADIQKKEIENNVRFSGFRDDTALLLKSCDLFVLPSRFEACPICVIEAIAAGIPVVASDTGCVRELLENGKSGIIIQPENPSALSDAILKLLIDEAYSKEIGEHAAEYAEANFKNEIFINKIKSVVMEILEK